ncbi:unnamed protein product [Rotaria socialis]|uniref:Uncharacterized protein n=1 Tax=Rotaria socialis TaxID=392032 RepID=A0A822AMH2_9BILA|nr:unnamed protein product [Rotaria socialis]
MDSKVDGANPWAFQSIGGGYGKDASQFYYMGKPTNGVNPWLFQSLEGSYGKNTPVFF